MAPRTRHRLNQDKCCLIVWAPLNPVYSNLKQKIERNNNIQFKGAYNYNKLDEILNEIDVGIVSPIWHDNAPQIVFEFFSKGIPIISSNLGGMSDFVKDNVNGFIYEYNNINALKEKMQKIINNPNLIIQFNKKIKKMKSIHTHVKEIENIYLNLMQNKKTKRINN